MFRITFATLSVLQLVRVSSVYVGLSLDGHVLLDAEASRHFHNASRSTDTLRPCKDSEGHDCGEEATKKQLVESPSSSLAELSEEKAASITKDLLRNVKSHEELKEQTLLRVKSLVMARDPNAPKRQLNDGEIEQISGGSSMLKKALMGAYKFTSKMRGGSMNTMASVASMAGVTSASDNCLLKLLYILYSSDDEDDYPYLPRKCGDFNYETGTNAGGGGLISSMR
eukprot:TRINITY_DN16032_c0_g1_i1.p1 TRINITY_DN16032_c0_g1~~TRINITY_DN16032_c0_g1_i1.p1  ORF type:complete len:226 (+),score=23.03 TRINITY_DN16032_c0_g1_i1:66-743(+)